MVVLEMQKILIDLEFSISQENPYPHVEEEEKASANSNNMRRVTTANKPTLFLAYKQSRIHYSVY